MAKMKILFLTKTSERRLKDVFWRRRVIRIYSSWSRHLEDVLKTSSEDEDKRRLQEVFVKMNVCWDHIRAWYIECTEWWYYEYCNEAFDDKISCEHLEVLATFQCQPKSLVNILTDVLKKNFIWMQLALLSFQC